MKNISVTAFVLIVFILGCNNRIENKETQISITPSDTTIVTYPSEIFNQESEKGVDLIFGLKSRLSMNDWNAKVFELSKEGLFYSIDSSTRTTENISIYKPYYRYSGKRGAIEFLLQPTFVVLPAPLGEVLGEIHFSINADKEDCVEFYNKLKLKLPSVVSGSKMYFLDLDPNSEKVKSYQSYWAKFIKTDNSDDYLTIDNALVNQAELTSDMVRCAVKFQTNPTLLFRYFENKVTDEQDGLSSEGTYPMSYDMGSYFKLLKSTASYNLFVTIKEKTNINSIIKEEPSEITQPRNLENDLK